MIDRYPDTYTMDDVEPGDGIDEQAGRWFKSKLMNCINALHEADRDQRLRIKGRLHILRDMFDMTEGELVALAEEFEAGDEMAEVLEYER